MANAICYDGYRLNVDAQVSDHERRTSLYSGSLFLYSPKTSALALTEFARELICDGFGQLDPLIAQYEMPVEEFVRIFAPIKPAFIHHPKTMQLMRNMMEEYGCNAETTLLDVPRLRAVTSDAYLTAGVGFAHHPHRDTWYSAPLCQINWWLPIYPINTECTIAFHPHYWDAVVPNGSSDFNYYEWNRTGRATAAQHIKSDTRPQPKATVPLDLQPEIRVVTEPGGSILFSAAQMHSTVPNTSGRTRFSIDFRTANLVDLRDGKAAPNLDSHPIGTSLRDFRRCSDLSPVPEEIVSVYDNAPVDTEAVLVYRPESTPASVR